MRTKILPIGVACLVLAAAITSLNCPRTRPLRIIYNQGAFGHVANYSELEYSDFFGAVSQMGDDFVLAENQNTITSVRWWGVYRNNIPANDDFTILVYEVFDDGPNTHPWYEYNADYVQRTSTGQSFTWGMTNVDIYEYNLEIDPCELEPGATYVISIVNDTGRWAWCINDSPTQGNHFGWHRDEEWGDWTSHAIDSAFVLWSNE